MVTKNLVYWILKHSVGMKIFNDQITTYIQNFKIAIIEIINIDLNDGLNLMGPKCFSLLLNAAHYCNKINI